MIKTTIKHFIAEQAINLMFNGFINNFKIFPLSKGKTVPYMEYNLDGIIVKGAVKIKNTLNDINGKITAVELYPIGITELTIHDPDDVTETQVDIIDSGMIWCERISKPEDEPLICKGEFHHNYRILIHTQNIIAIME